MTDVDDSDRAALRSELRWVEIVGVAIGLIIAAFLFASIAKGLNPPSNIEFTDPKTLHLSAEFNESNLGTTVDESGDVTARIVTAQFAFVPQCIVVPAGRPVTLRLASPDVIHGILITGTNVNTMVIPGYVAQVHTEFTRTGDLLMPCHEYCGIGHSQMFATVRVVPSSEFVPDEEGKVLCDAR